MDPRLLSRQDTAAYLGVHPKTVEAMTKRGELPAVRFNRHVKYDRRDLEKFIERRKGK